MGLDDFLCLNCRVPISLFFPDVTLQHVHKNRAMETRQESDTYWQCTPERAAPPRPVTGGSGTPGSGPCSSHSSASRLCGGGSSTGCKHSIMGCHFQAPVRGVKGFVRDSSQRREVLVDGIVRKEVWATCYSQRLKMLKRSRQ